MVVIDYCEEYTFVFLFLVLYKISLNAHISSELKKINTNSKEYKKTVSKNIKGHKQEKSATVIYG